MLLETWVHLLRCYKGRLIDSWWILSHVKSLVLLEQGALSSTTFSTYHLPNFMTCLVVKIVALLCLRNQTWRWLVELVWLVLTVESNVQWLVLTSWAPSNSWLRFKNVIFKMVSKHFVSNHRSSQNLDQLLAKQVSFNLVLKLFINESFSLNKISPFDFKIFGTLNLSNDSSIPSTWLSCVAKQLLCIFQLFLYLNQILAFHPSTCTGSSSFISLGLSFNTS